MNILDALIVCFVVFGAIRWYKLGFVRGLFSLVGLVIGIVVGVLLAPWVMAQFAASSIKFIVMLLVIGSSTTLFACAGEYLGHKLHLKLSDTKLVTPNAVAGSLLSIVVICGLFWICAGLLANSPYKALNRQIQNSFIIQALNSRLPATPPLIARVSTLLSPLEFPQVFVGAPPKLSPPVSPAGSAFLKEAVQNAGESTVRIEAVGCGAISTGSGFVFKEGLIMTNAHVLAGSNAIEVVDTTGRHRAELIYFDSAKDIAIVRSNSVTRKPLTISRQLFQRGQAAVVLGFPGGGDFSAEPAGIMRLMEARGYDIYNSSVVDRSIYEIKANVVQGNSGGPLVLDNGTVIGMIFASAQNEQGYGYALTSAELLEAIDRAGSNRVSSERCQAE